MTTMRVKIRKQCDGPGRPGERQALFTGQFYVLPRGHAEVLISEGLAKPAPLPEDKPVKAVEGPPEDKALKPAVRRRRGRPPKTK